MEKNKLAHSGKVFGWHCVMAGFVAGMPVAAVAGPTPIGLAIAASLTKPFATEAEASAMADKLNNPVSLT